MIKFITEGGACDQRREDKMLALIFTHPAAIGLVCYLILSAVIGSMPKLPDNASYSARWAYGALQVMGLNLRFAANFFKIPTPSVDEGKDQK